MLGAAPAFQREEKLIHKFTVANRGWFLTSFVWPAGAGLIADAHAHARSTHALQTKNPAANFLGGARARRVGPRLSRGFARACGADPDRALGGDAGGGVEVGRRAGVDGARGRRGARPDFHNARGGGAGGAGRGAAAAARAFSFRRAGTARGARFGVRYPDCGDAVRDRAVEGALPRRAGAFAFAPALGDRRGAVGRGDRAAGRGRGRGEGAAASQGRRPDGGAGG